MVSGDFNSAYTVEVTSTREAARPLPGVAPGGETHMKIAANGSAPCAAGQRPGDIIMSNGMTMNVLDHAEGHSAARADARERRRGGRCRRGLQPCAVTVTSTFMPRKSELAPV